MKELKTCRDLMKALSDGHTVEAESACGEKWNTVMEFRFDVTKLDDELLFEYRIKPIKPSIDWSQVSEKYRYLARDEDGSVYLYDREPELSLCMWWILDAGTCASAEVFKSLEVGNCDWRDSLVIRPDNEESAT